ncbi:uncharacterized protein CDAR_515401 [Caerostris darwini]|uniref:Ribosomal protein L20 n=1 Tax=Caerostris darwini TaxID=1538125 RepID=A0AAV4PNQ3_9ARAC|nr:uncharacterized protein CDAR_515401 [Caerostris darwini]
MRQTTPLIRDKSLRREKVLKMTAKYFGRRRNCYSIAIKFLQKALKYTTVGRKIKPQYLAQLRQTRLDAAAAEHGLDYWKLQSNLIKSGLSLHSQELQNLAIWEPRTFKCLTDIAKAKQKLDASPEVSERLPKPEGVITRGML